MKQRRDNIPVRLSVSLAVACSAAVAWLTSQDQYKVTGRKTEYTLPSYLLQEMHAQYDLRR